MPAPRETLGSPLGVSALGGLCPGQASLNFTGGNVTPSTDGKVEAGESARG